MEKILLCVCCCKFILKEIIKTKEETSKNKKLEIIISWVQSSFLLPKYTFSLLRINHFRSFKKESMLTIHIIFKK